MNPGDEFYIAGIKWCVYRTFAHAMNVTKVGTKGRKRYLVTAIENGQHEVRELLWSECRVGKTVAKGRIVQLPRRDLL